jgi:hypothetical protein
MKYLFNRNNLVRTAVVSALNIVPSAALFRTDVERTGGGQVVLGGAYTGQADATIDVEIRNDTIVGTPRVSAATLDGAGNGTLTDGAADPGLAAQGVVVTLIDLGTDTRQAYVPFQGVTLRAVDAGAGGNAIAISVSDGDAAAGGIALTDTDYSTVGEIRAELNEYVGDEWNFGHAALTPEGTIPASAPRIAFGDDPQVYRAFKEYRDGRFVYAFSPAPVRDVPAGTRVRTVTGARTVTVTDGVDTNTYANVTTLYSLLSQIGADAGALVEVDGVVVNDAQPGGLAAVEMNVRTASFVKAFAADGSSYAKKAEIGLVVADDAPTETLVIECANADTLGAEAWTVSGAVSGDLDHATTGVAYDGEHYDFTIPLQASNDNALAGRLTYDVHLANRNPAQAEPDVNVYRPVLGANARELELTFTYTRRPDPSCDASEQAVRGFPDPECLGLEPEGAPLSLTPRQQARVERIAALFRDVTARAQTYYVSADGVEGLGWVSNAAKAACEILAEGLNEIVTAGVVDYDEWAPSTVYELGEIVIPTAANRNGYRFRVIDAGQSAAVTEPTWTNTIGATYTDNGVTWENIGKEPLEAFDDVLAIVENDFEVYDGTWNTDAGGASLHVVSTVYNAGRIVFPATLAGRRFVAVVGGTSGGTAPTWPTSTGDTVTDGGVTWRALPRYWTANTAYTVVGQAGFVEGSRVWRVKTPGTSHATTEPTWRSGDLGEITDGSVVWEATEANVASALGNGITERYRARLEALVGSALAAAGLSPNFEGAGGSGTGCWLDDPSATYWWVCSDASYLPAFTNVYYHAVRTGFDQDGNEVLTPTMEFGFAIQACGALIEGDAVTIRITGTGAGRSYQVGDRFEVQVVKGAALALGGGQTGTDTLTWSVRGSVDGGFADYALNKTTPNTYSDGGLSFLITPGGLDFALGDSFTFYVEGGQFRWRQDGGAWSGDVQIADTVAIGADGLELAFVPGAGPSFVAGDTYSFEALATNGPEHLKQPTDGALAFDDATEIEVTHAGGSGTVRSLLIAQHAIPEGATITLQSWNGASYDPLAEVPWSAGDIYLELPADDAAAKHRLDVDAAGSIGYLYAGEALEAELVNGLRELGRAIKRVRMPTQLVARGLGVDVTHSALSEDSSDAIADGIAHATEHDDGRFAVVLNDEPALVEFTEGTLVLEDAFGFQPSDASKRFIALALQLTPAT